MDVLSGFYEGMLVPTFGFRCGNGLFEMCVCSIACRIDRIRNEVIQNLCGVEHEAALL